MKAAILILMALLNLNEDYTIYDFTSETKSGKWRIINDGVMGGLSESSFTINKDGTATFKGLVSLENNGGFASVRSQVDILKEEEFLGVSIRIKGDGNIYKLRFRTNNNFDGYAYQAEIQTLKDEWELYRIPFKSFKPTYRGYTLKGKPALKSGDIEQMGFLISNKQQGDFKMTVDWVKFYK